jgi:hypothetical protein
LTEAGSDAPSIWLRLCRAAWHAGHQARCVGDLLELSADIPAGSHAASTIRASGSDASALPAAAQILTQQRTDLVGTTRLADATVEQVGAKCGVSRSVLRNARRRTRRWAATRNRANSLDRPRVPTVSCDGTGSGERVGADVMAPTPHPS